MLKMIERPQFLVDVFDCIIFDVLLDPLKVLQTKGMIDLLYEGIESFAYIDLDRCLSFEHFLLGDVHTSLRQVELVLLE